MNALPATDEALMVLVQRDRRAAYEVLYHRWKAPLFQFLLRRTGSRPHAEEALQDTWTRLYRYRHTYTPGRPFRPWLFRIAANAGRDARRPEPTMVQLNGEAVPESCSHIDTIDLRNALLRALHDLSPQDRRLLLLAGEGFTSTELSQILDMPPSTVRTRLFRARQTIRETLHDT